MAAAARLIHRRVSFALLHQKPQPQASLLLQKDPSYRNFTRSSLFLFNGIQTQAETAEKNPNEDTPEKKLETTVAESGGDSSNVKYSSLSNLKSSSRHDLAMIFTCKVCETRQVKTACRESYEKGVVVARCAGCDNLHLIADHLGWFGKAGTVEDLLAERGEQVKRGSTDTLNLTLEDLAGIKV